MSSSTTKYVPPKYIVEHDNFFKYIKEYIQEESSHKHHRKYKCQKKMLINIKIPSIESDDNSVHSSDSEDYQYY